MKLPVLGLLVLITSVLFGQDQVVEWDMSTSNDTIIIKANIQEGWRIYASDLDPSIGPIPTTIYQKSDTCSTSSWETPPTKEKFDETFQAQVTYWSGNILFRNYSYCKTDKPYIIEVEYMACNHETCLPPTVITLETK